MARIEVSWTIGVALALAGVVSTASGRAASQVSQSVPTAPERVAEMRHHFGQVMTIHEAVIRGDLESVRVPRPRPSRRRPRRQSR